MESYHRPSHILTQTTRKSISYSAPAHSGTSIGANVEEGQAAQSRADFIAKYYIACKEARETHYWIRLLGASDVLSADRLSEISAECNELIAILTSTVKKLKNEGKV